MRIIGFAGRISAGKSTASDAVWQNEVAGLDWTPRAFAEPSKAMALLAFPELTRDQLYGSSQHREEPLKDYPITDTCPYCGTTALGHVVDTAGSSSAVCTVCVVPAPDDPMGRRTQYRQLPQYLTPRIILQTLAGDWGRRLGRNIWVKATLKNAAHDPATVISDVRYKNEVAAIRDAGGFTVFLLRGYDAKAPQAHPSEQLRPEDCDLVFDNRELSAQEFRDTLIPWLEREGLW